MSRNETLSLAALLCSRARYATHREDTNSALRRFDATARLKQVRDIRALVVSAKQDVIFPQRLWNRASGQNQGFAYSEIPDAAHGVTIQCAETVNRLSSEHFATAGGHRSDEPLRI